ncbi:MAG: hypothetical protein JWM41_1974 [Gemmatimonadetes bacterium]|nr:hypothetical protein [Gemmatimonadota bacterium]
MLVRCRALRTFAPAVVPLLLACGSDATAPTPTTTTVYAGTFVDAAQSGSFTLRLASSSSNLSSLAGASTSMAPTTATGTLSTVDGSTVTLSGTYDAATGALSVSGGAFTLAGTAQGSVLSGTFTGTHGTGAFAAAPTSSGTAPMVYCGTYSAPGNDVGWFNIVTTAAGTMSGVAHSINAPSKSSVTLTGTASATTLTFTSSDGATATGTRSADGSSLAGTFAQSGGGSGTFQGNTSECGGATGPTGATGATGTSGGGSTALTVAGRWGASGSQPAAMQEALLVTGTAISGSGAITVSIPSYTGDAFVITSGSFTNPSVTFTASLGSNPDGHGGTFVGSLSFTGTVTSATTMTGTLTYTPPRTATQIFATQTVAGVTLTKS